MDLIKFGILTVSDSCFRKEAIDISGPEVERLISDNNTEIGKNLRGQISCTDIVPDVKHLIQEKLLFWSDKEKVDVIFTIGGTGFSDRDVTPEATKEILHKEAPGMVVAMLTSSLKITPMAMLSRAACGIRYKTLIINLPGSPKAVRECLGIIAVTITHAVHLIKNDKGKIKDVHKNLQNESSLGACTNHCKGETSSCLEKVAIRSRESPFPMISVQEALEIIRKFVEPGISESVPLENAYGRILDTDSYSKYDLPPFRASIKDGYAVLASDGKGKRKVLSGIEAGSTKILVKLEPGSCVRVNTGAPIPDEATAIVQVEDTVLVEGSLDHNEEKEIDILTEVKHGQDIRPIGCDIHKEELILKAKTKLGPAELGLLASCGYDQVTVIELPKIGVLSTGDELQCAGKPLMPGRVYDSNKITLLSVLKEHGFHPMDLGIARDDESIMLNKLENALKQVDVLITSGSVSMGDRDMLKPILKHHFNAIIHFGRVNMKPGKPTTFATCTFEGRKKYILCLPGNPVSATVTAHLFALPLLKHLCCDYTKPMIVKAETTSSYNLDPRPEYARIILKWNDINLHPKAYSTGNQISSKLLSCRNANALLMLPARTKETPTLPKGHVVQTMLLGSTEYISSHE